MAEFLWHITTQKEAFDSISLEYYDDEAYAGLIAQANPEYAGVILFDAGVRLKVPILDAAPPESLPPWRQT